MIFIHQNDIAEEMARVFGYDNLKPKKFIANNIVNTNFDEQQYIEIFFSSTWF